MESRGVIHLIGMKSLKMIFFLMLIIGTGKTCLAQTPADAKKAAKQALIKNSIEDRSFTFIANQASPLSGSTINLTSIYDLKVKKDSAISFLPYFGRAYFDVGYNQTDLSFKFTSTKFDYQCVARKKGGWIITIKPTDVRNVLSLILSVSVNGYASLTITSTNRDVIYYDGYLQ